MELLGMTVIFAPELMEEVSEWGTPLGSKSLPNAFRSINQMQAAPTCSTVNADFTDWL